jgi:general stress protein 26
MTDHSNKAKAIIEENIYCTIATADSAGKPWISPVFFAFDQDYNIYWVSDKNARHSQNIVSNPEVAIVFFNSQAVEGEGDGVYMEATAEALTDETEIEQAIELRNQRVTQEDFKVKDIKEVTGAGELRIYKAVPVKMFKLSDGEYKNGQYIDTRIEVKF